MGLGSAWMRRASCYIRKVLPVVPRVTASFCGLLPLAVLEHLFVAIFILELFWRIYSERLRYFRELMNVFDSLLVLISCIDLYILTPLIQTSLNNTATLRLLRTIKLDAAA